MLADFAATHQQPPQHHHIYLEATPNLQFLCNLAIALAIAKPLKHLDLTFSKDPLVPVGSLDSITVTGYKDTPALCREMYRSKDILHRGARVDTANASSQQQHPVRNSRLACEDNDPNPRTEHA